MAGWAKGVLTSSEVMSQLIRGCGTWLLFIFMLRKVSCFSRLDYPTYNAVVGRKVALPCNVTPPTSDDGIALVLWYRGDSGSPIYSLDARTTAAEQAKHFASKVLGSRAYFNLSSRPSALYISPLREEDAAEYRCRVDFRRARTKNRVMKLIIITPPETAAIRTPANRTVQGLIGPFDEGTSLNLICEAKGGKPPPSVSWWKESILLDDRYEVSAQRIVLNELTISKLERLDLMATLTCQATNTNLTVPLSVSVTIDLNLKPQDIRIITPFQPLSAGRSVEISCQSTGSRPPAKISWWKEREELSDYRESVSSDGSITIGFLTFVPSSGDNGRKLSCRAENSKMENTTLEESWTLNVFYQPQLSIALGTAAQHSLIVEGGDIFFECNIQANPPVGAVTWLLDGHPLRTDKDMGISVNNSSLSIHHVSREHRGQFQCSASNNEGEGRSEAVMLNVRYAPVCKENQKFLYGVARHETATIACEVESDPPHVTFQWRFNNTEESLDVITYSSTGTKSFATYSPRTRYDYGVLYCWGKNNVGEQKEPCVFTIIPAGPPDPVENCSVLNHTATTLHLECEAGDDGGLQQQFHLEIYTSDTRELQANVTVKESPVFSAYHLAPGRSFLIVVYASNPKGKSKAVTMTASTLFSPKRRIGETPAILVSPVLAVLLGVVGLLVLLAIIIILIMKKRTHDETDESTDQGSIEKIHGSINLEKEMRLEGEDQCPDIIPPNNYITGERIYENLRSTKEPTYENIIKRVHFKTNECEGELTYAELILPSNCSEARAVRRDDPPTEYADINFQNSRGRVLEQEADEDASETPLMCPRYPTIFEPDMKSNFSPMV